MPIFAIIILLFSFSAFAENIPQPISQNIPQSSLIGKSKLKFFGLKVYDIALWGENSEFSYDKNFAIHIIYNMDFTAKDLAERSLEEIEKTHNLDRAEKESYLKTLNKIFVNIKKGDEKIAFFDPKNGVSIFHNSKLIGKISDLKFSRLFVDIWLDARGSYPDVTKELKRIQN